MAIARLERQSRDARARQKAKDIFIRTQKSRDDAVW
jgi:hypothetical protein